MPSTTVRISPLSQRILRDLAARTGEPMQALLEKAIEAYRREHFLEEANEAFAALRRNAKQWQAEREERAAWDVALSDGQEEPS